MALFLIPLTTVGRGVVSVDISKLNFNQRQRLQEEFVEFVKEVEKKIPLQQKLSWKMTVFSRAYASEGSTCFFGGWESQEIGGICKVPWIYGTRTEKYTSCGKWNLFRCAPQLFGGGDSGNGHCVSIQNGYQGLTDRCQEAAQKANSEVSVGNLQSMATKINSFCERRPLYDACESLKERIDNLNQKNDLTDCPPPPPAATDTVSNFISEIKVIGKKIAPPPAPPIKLNFEKRCTRRNKYLEEDLLGFLSSRGPQSSQPSPEDQHIKRCMLTTQKKAPDSRGIFNNKYEQCGRNRRGHVEIKKRARPCLSKNYVDTTFKAYQDVNQCLGLSPKELYPLINHESRFHLNIKSGTGALCLGQLTTVAIKDVHRIIHSKHEEVREYIGENFQAASLKTDNQFHLNSFDGLFESRQCQSLKAHIGQPLPTRSSKQERRCSLTKIPQGLYKCLMYSAIYFKTQKSYYQDFFKANTILSLPEDEKQKKMIVEVLGLYSYNGAGGPAGSQGVFVELEKYWQKKHWCRDECPPLSKEDVIHFASEARAFRKETNQFPKKVIEDLLKIDKKIKGGAQCGPSYYY